MNDLGDPDAESLAQIDEAPQIDDMDQQRTREIQKLFADQSILKSISPAALEANDTLEMLKVRIKELDETVKNIPYPFEGTDLIGAADELKSVNMKEKSAHVEIMTLMESVKGNISVDAQNGIDIKKRLHAKIVLMEETEGDEREGGSTFEGKGSSRHKDNMTNSTQLKIKNIVKKSTLPRRVSYYPSSVRAGFAVYACGPRKDSGSSHIRNFRAK